MLEALLAVEIFGIVGEILAADHAAQPPPMLRVVVAVEDVDPVVRPAALAREDVVRRHRRPESRLTAPRRLAEPRVVDERAADVVELRVLHRDLQPPPLAGRVALVERGQDRDRHQHAGAGVAEGRTRTDRPAAGLAGNRHVAAAGLRDHVEGEVVLVRAALAEALDLGVDQARVELVQLVPAEAQFLDRAGRHVLDEDVGLLRHVLDQREAARRFQIDRNGFFIGVVDHEVIGVGAGFRTGAENAAGFAAFRVFDLDDLGAELGHDLGAGRTGLELRQVEHAKPGEAVRRDGGFGHCVAPVCEGLAPG